MNIKTILKDRVLVLDGAMGTMIQQYGLVEEDYRGELFRHIPGILKGNNDLLVLTKPDIIKEIHTKYLQAGADIIETNTFNATSVSMEDYGLQNHICQINHAAALLAREAADRYTKLNPLKPRFVAGSIGPTNKTTSMSPDVSDPAFRSVKFDQLVNSYKEQIVALLEGGVDTLLIETIFDTLNAKAALYAAEEAMKITKLHVPIMLSLTLSDIGGRTLSGQTLGGFLASVMHADILSVGLNCSFGATDMKPFLRQLANMAPFYISAYPNAGLPNRFGEYDETPEVMAPQIKEYLDESLVNIIGGCCGTTPAHIAQYGKLVEHAQPHIPVSPSTSLCLSGLDLLEVKPENNFINIGERCNVAGSRMFLRLINEHKYEEASRIARRQVEDGAQILDINMDDAMLDAEKEMTHFLNLIASDPDICKVPLMIDSSKFNVIESGLKCIQGKCVVNSISLKEGEDVFLHQARLIKSLGAAAVVMAFDEKGQAENFNRKIEICRRAYSLLIDQANFNPQDIIFDPNVLAIATGIKEHDGYAVDFIRATEWIKKNLPGAKISGGVSNLSFSFRGNNYIREAMHAVFLYHAIAAGMDMGIVNPSTALSYNDIPADILELIEDVVLNRRPDATERLIELAEVIKEKGGEPKEIKKENRNEMDVDARLQMALIKGNSEFLQEDLDEALLKYNRAVDVIDAPLMSGMKIVGQLFAEGKMFLPQVVKTARTMKQAVAILQPHIEREKNDGGKQQPEGKFLIATVKGDVHDIGKNIVSVILACNNYEVIDLGVMVSTEEIVKQALEHKVDFIGLSGLITPSLEEMCRVATALNKHNLDIPLMIGGATTSKLHTAVKIAPLYSGPVIHVKDAAQNPLILAKLMNADTKEDFLDNLLIEQNKLRESVKEAAPLKSFAQAKADHYSIEWSKYTSVKPAHAGKVHHIDIPIQEIRSLINWKFFFNTWRLNPSFAQIADLDGCDSCLLKWLASFPVENRDKASEALKLFKEANRLLDTLSVDLKFTLKGSYGLFESHSENESICFNTPTGIVRIPCLRQQQIGDKEKPYNLSLVDFVAPKHSGVVDYTGLFAVTIGSDIDSLMHDYQREGDDFQALLLQSVADRLVEAAAEWIHWKIRTDYWGYAPSERFEPKTLIREKYQGIRPAVGYPSLPDLSLNFVLADALDFEKTNISLTEHGAMHPNASVCGLIIAHPLSHYFMVGAIDNEQRSAYQQQRGMNDDDIAKFIK